MFALSNLPCSPHSRILSSFGTLFSLSSFPSLYCCCCCCFPPTPSPHSSSLFHSALLIPPTVFSLLQRHHFNWGNVSVCLFLCTILYVCLCVWNRGGTRKRGRKSLIYESILWEMAWAKAGFFLWVCMSVHTCLYVCEGDEEKGFNLHLYLCVYPFRDLRCKEEASFHLFLHSNASYTLCKTPLNVEKIGQVQWMIDIPVFVAFFSFLSWHFFSLE